MKTLLLMRHAKAAKGLPGQCDFDRALTEEGRQVARQTGCLLGQLGIQPDRVIASAAIRTSETASLVASGFIRSAETVLLQELYNAPAYSVEITIRKQMSEEETCLLIVGHNPGIAGVMCRWSGESLSVPPATLTIFRTSRESWQNAGLEPQSGMTLAGIVQAGELVWKEP